MKFCLILCAIFFVFLLSPASAAFAAADDKLILNVTPPLFKLNIGPGEFWASSVKVVNANPYDITVYASVMNFQTRGEDGEGNLAPVVEEDPEISPNSLVNWIEVSSDPIFVPREKSVEVPFSVDIPENAPPGGHYAAVIIGTQPSKEEKGSAIRVSSFVSSLILLRISGDVREEGDIRAFFPDRTFYEKPDVDFTLRFENKGNVHIKPQGYITIYNMWGKERGKIAVNEKINFGNVLPQSTRKFVFEWQGEENFFESGRYKAVAALDFGKGASKNVSRSIYFWVVPLKPTFVIFGGFFLFLVLMTLGLRAYIRRTIDIARSQYDPGAGAHDAKGPSKYRKFAIYLLALALLLGASFFYFKDVLKRERDYGVIIKKEDGREINVSSQESIKAGIGEDSGAVDK